MGTFTYILPVEDIHRKPRLIAQPLRILRDHLFHIIEDETTGTYRVTSDNQREFHASPREAIKAFMKSDKTIDGSLNLLFLQQMAHTLDSGDLNDSTFIGDMATRVGAAFLAQPGGERRIRKSGVAIDPIYHRVVHRFDDI